MLLSFYLEWVIVLASLLSSAFFLSVFPSLPAAFLASLSVQSPLFSSTSLSVIVYFLYYRLSSSGPVGLSLLLLFRLLFFLLLFLVSMCPSLPLKRSGWLAAHCNNVLGWRIGNHRGYSNEERSRSILLRIMLDWSFAFMSIECFLMRVFEEAKHLSNQR